MTLKKVWFLSIWLIALSITNAQTLRSDSPPVSSHFLRRDWNELLRVPATWNGHAGIQPTVRFADQGRVITVADGSGCRVFQSMDTGLNDWEERSDIPPTPDQSEVSSCLWHQTSDGQVHLVVVIYITAMTYQTCSPVYQLFENRFDPNPISCLTMAAPRRCVNNGDDVFCACERTDDSLETESLGFRWTGQSYDIIARILAQSMHDVDGGLFGEESFFFFASLDATTEAPIWQKQIDNYVAIDTLAGSTRSATSCIMMNNRCVWQALDAGYAEFWCFNDNQNVFERMGALPGYQTQRVVCLYSSEQYLYLVQADSSQASGFYECNGESLPMSCQQLESTSLLFPSALDMDAYLYNGATSLEGALVAFIEVGNSNGTVLSLYQYGDPVIPSDPELGETGKHWPNWAKAIVWVVAVVVFLLLLLAMIRARQQVQEMQMHRER